MKDQHSFHLETGPAGGFTVRVILPRHAATETPVAETAAVKRLDEGA